MKKIIVYIMLMCSSAMAVEYGHFFRSDSSDGNAWNKSIILEEGDQFIFLGSDNIDYYASTYQAGSHCTVEFTCVYQGISITRSLTSFSEFRRQFGTSNGHSYGYGFDRSELSRTITGPCEITPTTNADDSIVDYKIIRAAESSAPSDSKYTASLNADGTRLAIGEQQGTNTSTRVYEYDDVTEAWEQLGDDVE